VIPLATLYYLLCYAWQRLPAPAVLRATEATPFHRPLELLTQMLLHATRARLRGGLPRGFQTQQAELRELRGHVELAPSLSRGLLPQGRAVCTYDELSANTPLHQLLLGTIGALATHRAVPVALRRELSQVRRSFPAEVAPLVPVARIFGELRRQRPASEEAFLLHLCELIYETALPAPADSGRGRFVDFRRDERLMARLFEQAVRNFYRREQRQYRVFAETIAWQAAAPVPQDLALLPTMLTDTTLESPARKIILDTKYYASLRRTSTNSTPTSKMCAPPPASSSKASCCTPPPRPPSMCATRWAATRCASPPSICTSPGRASPPICWHWWPKRAEGPGTKKGLCIAAKAFLGNLSGLGPGVITFSWWCQQQRQQREPLRHQQEQRS
jgi:5-methylcytosine-specific restriction enzyme subunit McrC